MLCRAKLTTYEKNVRGILVHLIFPEPQNISYDHKMKQGLSLSLSKYKILNILNPNIIKICITSNELLKHKREQGKCKTLAQEVI